MDVTATRLSAHSWFIALPREARSSPTPRRAGMRIVRRSPVPFLMALCCQAGLTDLATAASSWTNHGPDGGGVTAIAIDPVHPDTLYAGTWTAGTWKSIDGGSDWTHTSTGLPSSDVRDLA